jgi:UDP-GlcNAc:undecaprenyl-phosphate GlcNAc-1-phosphate transferase
LEASALVVSFLAALVVAPATLKAFTAAGMTRTNFRDRVLPFPAGTAIVASAALSLVVLAPLSELFDVDKIFTGRTGTVAVYALGTAFLGLLDDVVDAEPRGWRGHAVAILGGGLSTGALKAAGSLGFALFVLSGQGYTSGEYLLAVALLILTTNLFNLLDLRPGRAVKAFVILGAGLAIGTQDLHPLWALGLFAGPVLVLGVYDVRELAMLGDTGANLIGGLAGLWLVFALGTTGQLIALAVVLAATIYGEFRSISKWVERTPLVRDLDSLGRAR